MPELHVQPAVLADAGRSLTSQHSVLADAAAALGPAFDRVAAALPGSRTAEVAGTTATALAASLRAAAAELAQLAAALTAAARHYTVVERSAATGLEHAGRRPT